MEPLTARNFWQVLRLYETALRTDEGLQCMLD
jgi:hypothetical protein